MSLFVISTDVSINEEKFEAGDLRREFSLLLNVYGQVEVVRRGSTKLNLFSFYHLC